MGTNELAIVNRSGGLIDANVSVNGAGLALSVDPSAAGNLVNLGLMRASNGGTLLLTGNGGGVFTNTGGVIDAENGSQVQLRDGATVTEADLRDFVFTTPPRFYTRGNPDFFAGTAVEDAVAAELR